MILNIEACLRLQLENLLYFWRPFALFGFPTSSNEHFLAHHKIIKISIFRNSLPLGYLEQKESRPSLASVAESMILYNFPGFLENVHFL